MLAAERMKSEKRSRLSFNFRILTQQQQQQQKGKGGERSSIFLNFFASESELPSMFGIFEIYVGQILVGS